MNVSLTPELERLVADKVKSGMYQTASEVVREGLRLLADRDWLEHERREVAVGLAALERGEYKVYTDEDMPRLAAEIRARGMKRLAADKRRAKK